MRSQAFVWSLPVYEEEEGVEEAEVLNG